MLNNYFSTQTVINDQNKHLPQLPLATDTCFIFYYNFCRRFRDKLDNLDVKKACDPNHLSPRFLKEGAPILSQPLSVVCNRSLCQGYFPSLWKNGYLTPIHKKDDKFLPSNYLS